MSRAVFNEVEAYAPYFSWLEQLTEQTFKDIYKENYDFPGIGQHLWNRYQHMNTPSFLNTIDNEHQSLLFFKFHNRFTHGDLAWWHVMHFFHLFRNGFSISLAEQYKLLDVWEIFNNLQKRAAMTYMACTMLQRMRIVEAMNLYNIEMWRGECAQNYGIKYRCWDTRCALNHLTHKNQNN
jgi:hypothetical protein